MGCVGSKTPDATVPPGSPKKSISSPKKGVGGEKKEYSWDKQKAALNPEDFILKKLNGQTVVKEPGYLFLHFFLAPLFSTSFVLPSPHSSLLSLIPHSS
jgi:hypothetical protein